MDFEVLICGSDVNAYYMARLTHEAYGKKAYMLIRNKLAYTTHSKIIHQIYDDSIWNEKSFVKAVNNFSSRFKGKNILVISSNETYELFLTKNKSKFNDNIFFNYPNEDIIKSLIDKEEFYKTYSNSCLDFPKTLYYDCKSNEKIKLNFDFPVILKPSNVVIYNKLEFEGKKKIYKIDTKEELDKVIKLISQTDYKDTLIIQEYIPGDDSHLFDSVVYCDKNGNVNLISLAQIGLQEHNPNMVGNAAVLINGFSTFNVDKDVICSKIKSFMEEIGYVGFAEFDLKFDERDGKLKVLEINARQGRCSYYVTMCGHNLVKMLVDDLFLNKKTELTMVNDKVMLSFVNKTIIKKYVKNEVFKKEALKLYKKSVNPLKYSKDFSIYRFLLYIKRDKNYKKSYLNYKWD